MPFTSPYDSSVGFACLDSRVLGTVPTLPQEMALLPENTNSEVLKAFALGRHAARRALSQVGGPSSSPILRSSHRIPAWPDGFTGSISHSAKHEFVMACAVAGRLGDFDGIGIDIENLQRTIADGVIKKICTAREIEWCSADPQQKVRRAIQIFSAKEALFKAFGRIFPEGRTFEGAELVFHSENSAFEATLKPFISASIPENSKHWVSVEIQGDFVLSATAVSAEHRSKRWEPKR